MSRELGDRPTDAVQRAHTAFSRAAPLLLAVLLMLPYRRLLSYDPYAPFQRGLSSGDAFLFAGTDSSPGLVFALAAAIVAVRAGGLGAPIPNFRAAAPPACLAALLYLWGHYVGAATLLVGSLASLCVAASLACLARPGLRVMLPVAGLAIVAVPPPAQVIHAITYPLQLATARGVAFVAAAFGSEVQQSGDIVIIDGRMFEVVESCSGLRSALTLTTATLFYVGFFRRTPSSAAKLLLAAPAVALGANFLRALSLVYVSDSYFARAHMAQGMAVFGLGALCVALLDRRIGVVDRSLSDAAGALPVRGLAAVGILALLLVLASVAIPPWAPPPRIGLGLHDLATQIGGLRSHGLDTDRNFLGTVGFSDRLHRRFERNGVAVDVLIGEDDRLAPHVSMFSEKALLPGRGLHVTERGRFALEPDGRVVDSLRVEDLSGASWLVVYWWEGVGSRVSEFLRSVLALDRGLWRRVVPARLMRLTAQATTPGSAELAIRSFAPALRAELARLPGSEALASGSFR